jgi:hypothetical protein
MLRKISTIGLPVFTTRKRILALACTVFVSVTVLLLLPWALHADHRPAEPIDHSAHREAATRDAEASARSAALTRSGPIGARVSSGAVAAGRNIGAGLAENAWDFTAPDGVPGFGPLDPADAPQLLKRVGQAPGR